MATSWVIMALKIQNRSAVDVKNDFLMGTVGSQGRRFARRAVKALSDLLAGVVSGVRKGNLWLTVLDDSGTRATGNIACTQANAAGNFVRWTFGTLTVTLTEGVDFVRGANDTACAANLAAAINAHRILQTLMTALGSSGNCGLTAKIPTALLQDGAWSTDDATAFGLTQLTGGTEGVAQFLPQSFDTGPTP
ncbi:MAG TPA: hypothetical protein VED01_21405 [Burkholderiales bacterium]|nr:hypothetical protein [Burkholderiales bacterium]